MAAWLLSIVGVIAIGVLLDILMPEGETNKYIKGIFSIVVVLVIVAPLPKLIKSDFNIEQIFAGTGNYEIDESFLDSVNNDKKKVLEKKLVEQMNTASVYVKSVRIDIDNKTNTYSYVKVYLDKKKIGDAKIAAASIKAKEIISSNKQLSKCEVDVYAE